MSQKLQWTHTIARSGKLKDVPNVFSDHREAIRNPSRKKYHVRFQGEKVKKRRAKGALPSPTLDMTPCSPPSDVNRVTKDSLADHIPELSDSEPASANYAAESTYCLDHLRVEEIPGVPFHSLDLDIVLGSVTPLLDWPSPGTQLLSCNDRAEHDACSSLSPASFQSLTSSTIDRARHELQDYAESLDSANMGMLAVGPNISGQVDFLANAAALELCAENLSSQSFLTDPIDRVTAVAGATPLQTINISGQQHSSRYLQYYIEQLVPRFTPLWNAMDNPFLTFVIPGFLSSPILSQAVMSLAASQFALMPDLSHKKMDVHNALQYQTNLITALKHGSKNLNDPDPTNLLACIMMQSAEVLNSGVKGWHQWLQICLSLLKARNRMEQDMQDDTLWSLLTKITVAMETLTAITADTDITLAIRYWDLYLAGRPGPANASFEPGYSFQIQDAFFEKLLGCPATVLYVLADMAAHSIFFKDPDHTTHHPAAIAEKIAQWEQLLYGWHTVSNDPKSKLMEAFRHASLVHFLRRVRQLPYTHGVVQYHVRLVIENLTGLDDKDYTVIATWPAMMAGLELDEIANPDLAAALVSVVGHGGSRRRQDPMFREAGDWLKLFWKHRKLSRSPEARMSLIWQDAAAEHGCRWSFW